MYSAAVEGDLFQDVLLNSPKVKCVASCIAFWSLT